MLHAVTNLVTSATGVAIAPEFRIPYTVLDSLMEELSII
jgi:hypothetical protein